LERTFAELGLKTEILERLHEIGYEKPTPVQGQAIPYMLENNRDLIALAHTGTGKTAAFGLPILNKIDIEVRTPQALILSPTRELCLQISKDLASYSDKMRGLKVTSVYGGANIATQIRELRAGTHIVVATPGRILDLLNRGKVDFSKINSLVLDEADEMLNMGFKDDLDAILATIPEGKRTYLFSATMPEEIRRISKNYMVDPETLRASNINKPTGNIKHQHYLVRHTDRYAALKRTIDSNPGLYGIVFCRTKRTTQEVADWLVKDKYRAEALHGDLSQAQRDYVMHKFRQGALSLLVATDVAARGIDVDSLTHVFHYDLPDEGETYRHRSGRTGRAGKEGISISLITPSEHRKLKKIERSLGARMDRIEVPTGEQVCQNQLLALVDKVEKAEVDTSLIQDFWPILKERLVDMDSEDLIQRFFALEFQAYLREYRDAPDIRTPKTYNEDRGPGRDRPSRGSRDMQTLEINIGRRDKITVPKLLDLINKTVGRGHIPIGAIDLLRNQSRFQVSPKYGDLILRSFRGADFHGRKITIEPVEDVHRYSPSKRHREPRRKTERYRK